MQGMEERYKKYIEKAKSVIKTLDPKQNPNAAPEMSALRNQLGEKDRLIETLEQVNRAVCEIEAFVEVFYVKKSNTLNITYAKFPCV